MYQQAGSHYFKFLNSFLFSSKNSFNQGFTLIELLITISLLFIMTSMAMPSMTSTLVNNRQNTHMNTLMAYLQLTRTEAIFENHSMIMCKSRDLKKCDESSDWRDGWIIFSDKDNNKQINDGETIINKHGVLNQAGAILYQSFSAGDNYVQFYNAGYSHTNGTFIFCHQQSINKAKSVIISRTGRIRSEAKPPESIQKKCLPFVKSD